jgi:(4S)-4-hydroxy-5-phosphonooxypentane-2,3-dione isomerase
MLIQSIHYTFAPENAERAAVILKELRDLSRQEPGVVSFDVARSKDRPNVFALWEAYRDEAALKTHVDTEHFKRLAVNGVRPLAKERLGETVFPLE